MARAYWGSSLQAVAASLLVPSASSLKNCFVGATTVPLCVGRFKDSCLFSRRVQACSPFHASTADALPLYEVAPTNDALPILRKRVVSGIQPTGMIHLGNYLGAIKTWVSLQDLYDTLFFIVDLHAITLQHDPEELSKATRNSAAMYIACGVDPAKASIFVQSHVEAHAELTWLLSCVTPIGWLNKMIQFKEKSRKAGDENVGSGLLTYPVLMASDILLYQCDLVPVGDDQRQHLEFTRDIAERFNNLYGAVEAKFSRFQRH